MSFFRELERLAQGMGNDMQQGGYQNQGYQGNQGAYANPQQGYAGNQAHFDYDAQMQQMPDHVCHPCNTPMNYQGAHALRTGGMSRGFGLAADLFLGGNTEDLLNTATERNVIVHVFVCQHCGRIEFVNDPRKGF